MNSTILACCKFQSFSHLTYSTDTVAEVAQAFLGSSPHCYTPRCWHDIWAFGLLLLALLGGRRPKAHLRAFQKGTTLQYARSQQVSLLVACKSCPKQSLLVCLTVPAWLRHTPAQQAQSCWQHKRSRIYNSTVTGKGHGDIQVVIERAVWHRWSSPGCRLRWMLL